MISVIASASQMGPWEALFILIVVLVFLAKGKK